METILSSRRLTHQEFLSAISSRRDIEDYEILGEYRGRVVKIPFRHRKCGNTFRMRAKDFRRGRGCPVCARNTLITQDQFVSEVAAAEGDNYTVLGRYRGNKAHILLSHNVCGHKYQSTRLRFITGQRCPRCKESKGEKAIRETLVANDLNFKSQYRFLDCRRKLPLPFDFAILSADGEVEYLIEFDGVQHFNPVPVFGGQEAFEERLQSDAIKSEYCARRGIPLLRIRYDQIHEVPQLIEKFITKTEMERIIYDNSIPNWYGSFSSINGN